MTEDQIQEKEAGIPIPRLSDPNDIAETVFYLATRTDMTTGQLLVVDGGRTM